MIEFKLRNFKVRLVEEADASFIVALRTDSLLSKHLHATSTDIELQKEWIKAYKKREEDKKEYYFISETYNNERLGLNRLYNFANDTFELGSWIFKKGIDESIPILADIKVRDFAYDELGFAKCRFEVRKENKVVVRYHQLYKPTLVEEDEANFYFELTNDTYKSNKDKILKIFGYGS